MVTQKSVSIPGAWPIAFQGGIKHPDLWLWDSWLLETPGQIHLYCLALSRNAEDGSAVLVGERNQFPFHIRHFVSRDNGRTWSDQGAVITPGRFVDRSDARNIWSGSVTKLADGRELFAYTGISETTPDRQFVQNICLMIGEGDGAVPMTAGDALSNSLREYDAIRNAGYYLGEEATLGSNTGESDGPITAWRDPFALQDAQGQIHMFWSAKIESRVPAIAHAILKTSGEGFVIDQLMAPITLPDADEFTQAEVPKLYRDEARGLYYLLISACNRLHEGQPDEEVSKEHRLYKSESLRGPWETFEPSGSVVPGLNDLFGASILSADFESGEIRFIASYTEMASSELQLTFAPVRSVSIFQHVRSGIGKTG